MQVQKSDIQIKVISQIRELRSQNNISQLQLSKDLGISAGQIGNIESPKYPHKYTLKQLNIVCKLFNYPIENVFLNEVELKSPQHKIVELLINKIIEYDE